MIKIKNATKNDIDLIETLYRNRILQLANKNIKQWEYEEVTWEALSKSYECHDFYIVEKEEKAVGAFAIVDYDPSYWCNDKKGEALYLHKVMVDESVEKQGVSDKILDYFKEKGKKEGYSKVKLDVREYKDKLRKFYERNGFVLKEIVDLKKGYLTCLYEYEIEK